MKKKRRSLIEFNKTMSQSYLVEESINGQFGIGEEDEGNNLSYIPEEEREVFIDRAQLSIFELHRRCRRGDIILQPSYQRKDVWTKPKNQNLLNQF